MAEERDFVMARLAAGRAYATSAIAQLDECLGFFVDPELDGDGKERTELLEGVVEDAGLLSRAIEAAQELLGDIDFTEGEPDLPEGDGYDEPNEDDPATGGEQHDKH